MKTKNIVSITMINAFLLMMFGSFLSGCQKKQISKTGFYSNLTTTNRMPASTSDKGFENFQDPKQIYIYCSYNEPNSKQCYNLYLNQKITEYKKKNSSFEKYPSLEYESVKASVEQLNSKLLKVVTNKLDSKIKARETFCEKNSKYHLDRCLNQYVNKESLEVLNTIKDESNPLNGHEYLYLKREIETKMKEKLDISKQNIISRKKKAL